MSCQNQTCEILPSPFTSSSLRISLISYSLGYSTLKASVNRVRSCPSSCFSIFPELSVSNVRNAFFNSLRATLILYSKLIKFYSKNLMYFINPNVRNDQFIKSKMEKLSIFRHDQAPSFRLFPVLFALCFFFLHRFNNSMQYSALFVLFGGQWWDSCG